MRNGDLVIIARKGADHTSPQMDEFLGRRAVIISSSANIYTLNVDQGRFHWNEHALDKINPPKIGETVLVTASDDEVFPYSGVITELRRYSGSTAKLACDNESYDFCISDLIPRPNFMYGELVCLSKHRRTSAALTSDNWSASMESYVGLSGFVDLLYEEADPWGKKVAKISCAPDVQWRLESLKLSREEWFKKIFKEGDPVYIDISSLMASSTLNIREMELFDRRGAVITSIQRGNGPSLYKLNLDGNQLWWPESAIRPLTFNVGDEVILGPHVEVNGHRNWSTRMGDYLNARTVITEISPYLDEDGCEWAHVEADHRQYKWRIMSMKLYKKNILAHHIFKLNERVKIVAPHSDSQNWSSEQDSYLGMVTSIRTIDATRDDWGELVCTLEIDGGVNLWRLSSLSPCKGDLVKMTPKEKIFEFNQETKYDRFSITNAKQVDGHVVMTLEDKKKGGVASVRYETSDLAKFFKAAARMMLGEPLKPKEDIKVEAKEKLDKPEAKERLKKRKKSNSEGIVITSSTL